MNEKKYFNFVFTESLNRVLPVFSYSPLTMLAPIFGSKPWKRSNQEYCSSAANIQRGDCKICFYLENRKDWDHLGAYNIFIDKVVFCIIWMGQHFTIPKVNEFEDLNCFYG